MKYDTLGNYVWSRWLGFNPADPSLVMLTFDNNNNIIINGGYNSSTDFNYGIGTFSLNAFTTAGWNNYFVMKTDSQLNFIWVNAFHSFTNSNLIKLRCDALGNIFIYGSAGNPRFFPKYYDTTYVKFGTGGWNPFIIKYNGSSGNYISDFYLNRPSPYDMDIAADGTIYLSGLFAGTADFDPGPSVYNLTGGVVGDAFMAVYDNNFNFFRAYKYTNQPTPDDYQCGWFIRAWYSTVYLYSLQNGNVNYGTLSFPYMINSIYAKALIKFNFQSVMVGEDGWEEGKKEVYLFPNPSSGLFTLHSPGGELFIDIRNILGESIYSRKTSAEELTLDLSDQAKGLYFVRIHSAGKITSQKIVIR